MDDRTRRVSSYFKSKQSANRGDVTRRVDLGDSNRTRRVPILGGSGAERAGAEGSGPGSPGVGSSGAGGSSAGSHGAESAGGAGSSLRPITSGGRIMPLGALPARTELPGGCIVKETLNPHESQRPGLYLCSAAEGDVIVKIAPTEYSPRPDVWATLTKLRHPSVLRTYRTIESEGLYYEIQEYCAGGTLAGLIERSAGDFTTVTAAWVMGTLIPQVNEGLKYLHDRDIVHRDIKPSNIYRKIEGGRETLVLGDFDVSAVLDRARTSRDTQRMGGTWYYTAPEAFPRFVDESVTMQRGRVTRSADYYSLGVTIVELLQGTTSLHMCELPDLFDFYLQGNTVAIPQNIPERLSLLLQGLLIRNRKTRWGAEEIDRWLKGNTTEGDRRRILNDRAYDLPRASRPYRLKALSPVDLPGLADAMYREMDAAMGDLMSGDVLLNWVGSIDANKARAMRSAREAFRQDPETALFAAITICDPLRPFIMGDGHEVETAEDWLRHVEECSNPNRFVTEKALSRLSVWLGLKADPDKRVADRIQGVMRQPHQVRLAEMAYLIDPRRPYQIMPGTEGCTPKEIARATYGDPEDWAEGPPECYRASFFLWQNGTLYAWMRQRGLGAVATRASEVGKDLSEHQYAAFETVLRLMDPDLPPVTVRLSTGGLAGGLMVSHGKSRTVSIPYSVVGRGIPFGSLRLADDVPGLWLSDQLIENRSGTANLTLDASEGLPASRRFQTQILMDGGFTRLEGGSKALTYGATLPVWGTIGRIVIGVILGALIVGGVRYIASLAIDIPVSPRWDAGEVWTLTRDGEYPYSHELGVAGLIVLATLICWWFWTLYRRTE